MLHRLTALKLNCAYFNLEKKEKAVQYYTQTGQMNWLFIKHVKLSYEQYQLNLFVLHAP